jgi:hypothetical protein
VKVPSFDEMVDCITETAYPPQPYRARADGYDFELYGHGWNGTDLRTSLPDGSTLNVLIRLTSGPKIPLLGYVRRRSSFRLSLAPAGSRRAESILAKPLTDSLELTGTASAKLIPAVEAGFSVARAAVAPLKAARAAQERAEADAEQAKLSAERGRWDPVLAGFVGFTTADSRVHPFTHGQLRLRYGLEREERQVTVAGIAFEFFASGDERNEFRGDQRGFLHRSNQAGEDGYFERNPVNLFIRPAGSTYHPVHGDSDLPPLTQAKVDSAEIIVSQGLFYAAFSDTAEIADPALRGLANVMLEARAEYARRLDALIAAQAANDAAHQAAALAALAAFDPDANGAPKTVVYAHVSLPAPISPYALKLPFVQLPNGRWASNAVVAVRRGPTGEKVYAEAIHLPAGILPARIEVGVQDLRLFRDLPATILGWVESPSGAIVPTADPALWDDDYVSGHPRTPLVAGARD